MKLINLFLRKKVENKVLGMRFANNDATFFLKHLFFILQSILLIYQKFY